MEDFLKIAKGGMIFLFGNGKFKLNPIHGADLAKVFTDNIKSEVKEINIGGPDVLLKMKLEN